jgi:hypothetical protein
VELLAAGALRPGEPLIAIYKRERYATELLPDGRARGIAGGPDGTLSMVARQVTGAPVNGWRFWGVEREGRLVKLAQIRDELARRGLTPARVEAEGDLPVIRVPAGTPPITPETVRRALDED